MEKMITTVTMIDYGQSSLFPACSRGVVGSVDAGRPGVNLTCVEPAFVSSEFVSSGSDLDWGTGVRGQVATTQLINLNTNSAAVAYLRNRTGAEFTVQDSLRSPVH